MNTGEIGEFVEKRASNWNQLAQYVHHEGQAGYFPL
jgi:hypothetical protein